MTGGGGVVEKIHLVDHVVLALFVVGHHGSQRGQSTLQEKSRAYERVLLEREIS